VHLNQVVKSLLFKEIYTGDYDEDRALELCGAVQSANG
jgi:hypothetical protein